VERKKILLAVDDPSLSQRLISELAQYGYTAEHFQTGSKALEYANTGQSNFIIADIQLPDMDGIELCWMIRETSSVPNIPFILLIDTDDPEIRINGFRSGADAFILKPGSMREIVTRIETLLRRIEQPLTTTPIVCKSLCGTIPDFSLIEILQILNMTKKSGTLTVKGDANVGKIGLLDGNLVWSEQDSLEGEEAIIAMAFWEKASFEFDKKLVFKKYHIKKPTMEVILHCCNVLDEKKSDTIQNDKEYPGSPREDEPGL